MIVNLIKNYRNIYPIEYSIVESDPLISQILTAICHGLTTHTTCRIRSFAQLMVHLDDRNILDSHTLCPVKLFSMEPINPPKYCLVHFKETLVNSQTVLSILAK